MKKTLGRKTTVTSSLNVIFTDQLGNRVVVSEGGVTKPAPSLSRHIFKDTVNGFPPIFAS
jgi:hypothetical protein